MEFKAFRKQMTIAIMGFVMSGLTWFPLLCRADSRLPSLEVDETMVRSTFKIQSGNIIGTAFILVNIMTPTTNGAGLGYPVLITAAHVLGAMESTNATLWIRVKLGDDYQKAPFEFPIKVNGTNLWVRHPQADVAAMRISLPPEVDVGRLGTTFLADDKFLTDFHIHPGDELRVAGYPYGFEANASAFPVLRSGKIASFPLTPVSKTKTFLLDFPVFPGNSGGPAYISERRAMTEGSLESVTIFKIMGLVTEEALLTEPIKTLNADSIIRHQLGIGIVVHAQLIKDTIDLLPRQ
jgi:hypothetical protein